MKYNCLRINPYVKMFVVGLLLYLGETVFFKCSEEDVFVINIKTQDNGVIDVLKCKKTDTLGAFVDRVEKVFLEKCGTQEMLEVGYGLAYNEFLFYDSKSTTTDKKSKTLEVLGLVNNAYVTIHLESPEETKGPTSNENKKTQNLEDPNNGQPQYPLHTEPQKTFDVLTYPYKKATSMPKCIQCCLRLCGC